MELNYSAIGVRVKAARVRKGLTQGKLAKSIGLSTPHISNIETGNTKLGLPTLVSLANALDVSADEMLCDNIQRSENVFRKEVAEILDGCTVDELRVITALAKAVRKAGINSAKKPRHRRTKAQLAADRAAEAANVAKEE